MIGETTSAKLRQRTSEELLEQGRVLAIVRNVLVSHRVTPVITGGTFLGAVRDGGFIPWDWDAEFTVFYEQVKYKGDEIVKSLAQAGFEIRKARYGRRSWKIEVCSGDFMVEIRAWHQVGNMLRREMFRLPANYLEELGTIELSGETYQCPKDADGYLRYVYGDWRTPQRTADKGAYLSGEFYDDRLSVGRWTGKVMRRWRRIMDWVGELFRHG